MPRRCCRRSVPPGTEPALPCFRQSTWVYAPHDTRTSRGAMGPGQTDLRSGSRGKPAARTGRTMHRSPRPPSSEVSKNNKRLAARAASPSQTWWRRWGSNPRPQACKARALPTELRPRLGMPPVASVHDTAFPARSTTGATHGRESNKRPSGDSAHAGAFIGEKVVGPTRFELVTSRLSAGRSDQLSYGPTCDVFATTRLAIISQCVSNGQHLFQNYFGVFPSGGFG